MSIAHIPRTVFLLFIISTGVGVIGWAIPAGTGIQSGHLAPITFNQVVSSNSTSANHALSFLTSPSWTTLLNQSMIVIASTSGTFAPTSVVSVTDTLSDHFSKVISRQATFSGEVYDLEAWFGISASASAINAVTVTWNNTNQEGNLLQVALYQNIASVINATSNISSALPPTASNMITAIKSGDWMLGATSTSANVGTEGCTNISAESQGFVTRNKACSLPGITDGINTWVSDNATSLRNGISVTYSPTIASGPFGTIGIELDIVSTDLEPLQQNVNISSLCTLAGTDTCHINFANRASGANTLQNIVVGTTYCTGITTASLTISSTSNVQALGAYSGQSRNDTGAILEIELLVGTSAPSTTFGSGHCAAGGATIANGKLYFATSGLATTAFGLNEYSIALNGVCSLASSPCNSANTVFGWLEIIPESVGTGNVGSTIQYAQWGATPHSSLSLIQIK